MMKALVALFLGMFLSASRAFGPDGCMPEDVVGKWTFYMDGGNHDEYSICEKTEHVTTFELELLLPNKVVDMYGNEGKWSMVDGNGIEVVIHGRKYFSYFDEEWGICYKTLGYSQDVMNKNRYCFEGLKSESNTSSLNISPIDWSDDEENDHMMYKVDESFIEKINSDDNILWYAKKYEEFEKMTVGQMKQLMGKKRFIKPIKPAKANQKIKSEVSKLPENFDWRNVSGVNYISPVRSQGECLSCYAMASVGMNEARLNIASGGTINVTLSVQDVIECNKYTYGCLGGFEYLAAGKFSEENGMVEESCNPYRDVDGDCDIDRRNKCKKYYFTDYEYVGGFFGTCNEEAMKLALMHGPITASLVGYGLRGYGGGIYHDTKFEHPQFSRTHAVLIVGYGVEESTNTKYWIAKNSFGEKWGEQGYFRILRGTNEFGIETAAFQAFPIF